MAPGVGPRWSVFLGWEASWAGSIVTARVEIRASFVSRACFSMGISRFCTDVEKETGSSGIIPEL